ncbi:MAG: hypothetical protein Q9162_005448 [Coniocarpon cinnabarinum]
MTPPHSPDRNRRSASVSTPTRVAEEARAEPVPSIFSGQRSYSSSSPNPAAAARRQRATSVSNDTGAPNLGPISPDAVDRVFPMRSFVSVDPTPTPSQARDKRDGYFSSVMRDAMGRTASHMSRGNSSTGAPAPIMEEPGASFRPGLTQRQSYGLGNGPRKGSADGSDRFNLRGGEGPYAIMSDAASVGSESLTGRPPTPSRAGSVASARTGKDVDDTGGLVTARFKHVVTEGGHAVITGRDGETLQRCEDEPIHIPGAVQSFGLLVALQEEEEGRLTVRVVSENSKRILGYTPRQLFALSSFTDILADDQADNLLDHVDFIRDEGTDVETNGPEVFTLSVRGPTRRSKKLWCAIHINDAHPDLIICEFELEDDPEFPLTAPNDQTPEPPEDTLASEPTEEEYKESTETSSRPLRVLRSARKRKGEAAAMEVFNIMSQVQEQLAEAPTLDAFLKILVGIVKELTGFHRVMVYQFDQQWNGKVVTELVDPRATKDLYKGLHFPASDIPKQARDLYRINRVRLLYDRDHETSRLVCRSVEDLETPVDLTHSYLRAMSPIHIKYLANMAVRSSMSISINAFNELWGLISCHTYGAHGTRVSFPIRKMCRLVGDFASRNIERLSYASRLQARKLINTKPTRKNPSGYIIASSDDLLNLFDSDFGLLSIHGETKILGKLEATQEALAMVEYLRVRSFTSVLTSTDIREDFPDLRYPPGFQTLAGLLLVPLSTSGADFIVFFRKGVLKEVRWAGNPYEKYIKEGTEGYLEPRKSFKTWSERVVGKCREWTEEEVETAAVLCLVYGKFIEVWRQKEAALENSHLTKLLLANSAHEVRTPLNAIINYLEIAMEGSLDQETRENLSKSHSASKSLIYVINDLLDLTKTEAGVETIREDAIDLPATFHEAVDPFRGEATRRGIEYTITAHQHVPERVLADQRRIRQAISNIVANAFEATTRGSIWIEMKVVGREGSRVEVEIVVEDTGSGMNNEMMDKLFAQLEQVQAESTGIIEETLAPNNTKTIEKDGKQALGLGLAVVARVVKNMNGQLRLKSEEGKGSRFVMTFPFEIPAAPEEERMLEGESEPKSPVYKSPPDTFKTLQEKTLIASGQNQKGHGDPDTGNTLARRASADSLRSAKSQNSMHSARSGRSMSSQLSGKSDVDRLIEAMQEPHMVEGPSAERPSTGTRRRREVSGHVSWDTPPGSADPRRSTSFDTSPVEPSSAKQLDRHSYPSTPGMEYVAGSSQPIRPVRVPDETESPASERHNATGQILGDETTKRVASPEPVQPRQFDATHLQVLVAEDDPINSKIVQKRMEKAGHEIHLAMNGDECASAYGNHPGKFDVVLMDMQMPIVDGLTSTKMIRSFEKSHPTNILSERASLNGRVPVIAVSATLAENERDQYVEAGFDAWILKPINFTRLQELMRGIVDGETRSGCLYKPGKWEQGGWFRQAQPDVFAASTQPEAKQPFASTEKQNEARSLEQERDQAAQPEAERRANEEAKKENAGPSLT